MLPESSERAGPSKTDHVNQTALLKIPGTSIFGRTVAPSSAPLLGRSGRRLKSCYPIPATGQIARGRLDHFDVRAGLAKSAETIDELALEPAFQDDLRIVAK
jgi:hypothetical protein